MLLITFVKLFHLLGLIMGLGGALLLDMTMFTRGVIRPISHFTIHQTHVLSRVVSLGLVILWVTGFALIWMNYQVKPGYISNPKLWAKIAIVLMLTLNGFIIHNKVLPILEKRVGLRLFQGMSSKHIAGLTLIGAISVTSWFAPFILGKASELNYVTPMFTIVAVYVAGICIAWAGMFTVMSSITRIQAFLTDMAAKVHQPSDEWENTDLPMANVLNMRREAIVATQVPVHSGPLRKQIFRTVTG